MKPYDFIILTDNHFIQSPTTPFEENAFREDQLVMQALEQRGFHVGRKSWADPDFDWSSTKAAIFRTTWDYFDRFDEWQKWLKKVSAQTRLINSYEMARWNMDKHYLGELLEKGIHIPETRYVGIGEQTTLQALYKETGWSDAILKPCIAGSARHTYRLDLSEPGHLETTFQELIAKEAMMIQPFQHNILEGGEISLMIIGGQFTHAVIKRAKPGDFRVQDDHGGTVALYEPTSEEITFAQKAVAALPETAPYARVDIIKDNEGRHALIELELIEPELWFRFKPEAAGVLADYLLTQTL